MALSSRFKVATCLGCVVVSLLGGAALIFGVAVLASRHVPADALLAFELEGAVPELADDSLLSELVGSRPLTRRDLRDALVRAARDESVRAVRVKVGSVEAGFATLQEIRELLLAVGKAGKPTTAYLETAGEGGPGNRAYFLATGCQRVVLGPVGEVSLVALSARRVFLRGTFDKLGIEPEFPGIGEYKTARFMYTEKAFTPEDREMTTWLLTSLAGQLARGIAASRGLTEGEVTGLLAAGPFSAEEAVQRRLVDEVADWGSLVEATEKLGSEELTPVPVRRYLRSGRPDERGATVAVVVAEGQILRGESGFSPVPLLGGEIMGSDTIARALRQARESHPSAVIFRVGSPGGSPVASEIIRQEVVRTAREVPVVVSMADVAASGGYWISCGASRIVADPGTLTASIGVFGGHLAMERFWEEKLGITWGRVDLAENASLYDTLSPWTPAQRELQQRWLDRIYEQFLERVGAARKMTREQVDAVGRGRVFTGEQALERGLVDELGGFDAALAAARKLARLEPEEGVRLVFYPTPRPLWQRVLGRDDSEARAEAALRAILAGKALVPGPVWMPPLEVE